MPYTSDQHKEASSKIPRDSHGHFAHTESPDKSSPAEHPFLSALRSQTSLSNSHDDKTLVDVHVNNPLNRITELLEEIKRQKAFSFTLKGSLGIMGVVLALSTFGIFGTTHALCDKGIQSQIGQVRVLRMSDDVTESWIDKARMVLDVYLHPFSSRKEQRVDPRVVLLTPDSRLIHLQSIFSLSAYADQSVIVTGKYDQCVENISITSPTAIQLTQ